MVNIKMVNFEDNILFDYNNIPLPHLPRIGDRFTLIMDNFDTHELIWYMEENFGYVRLAGVEHVYTHSENVYKINIILAFSYDQRFKSVFWQSLYEKTFGGRE
jgi:hypothetical protein